MASVLTAVTSTVALSYLGVAGTLIGAAAAAILTAFANYAYTRSLVRTQVVVTQLAPRYLRTSSSAEETAVLEPSRVPPPTEVASTGLLEPVVTTDVIPLAAAPEVAVVTRETPLVVPVGPQLDRATSAPGRTVAADAPTLAEGRALMAPARRSARRAFGIVAVTTFLVIVLTLTVVELGLGRPLSKALRGVEGSGTTITRVRERVRPAPTTPPADEPTRAPVPTETPTESPTPVPSPTVTDEPTVPPTDEPTDVPTVEPTDPASPGPASPGPTTEPTDLSTDAPTVAPAFPEPTGTPVPSPAPPLSDADTAEPAVD
ncbi:hypothetical protein [Sanguibacter sp. A246]|uniref:hypothetical protein n=1 Tax=Sanguibacter sp. A246 TaxID=3457326 RepID=UPI003FD7BB5B